MAKILIVEDDNNLREIYGDRLEAEGHTILAANDGEAALAVAVRERPDLIMTDVMMPKISGFDMLDILRSTPETKNVKVLVLTALSQDEDRKRGEQLGADGYIVKSQVMLEDIVDKVNESLRGIAGTSLPASSGSPADQPVMTDASQTNAAAASSLDSNGASSSILDQPASPSIDSATPSTDNQVAATAPASVDPVPTASFSPSNDSSVPAQPTSNDLAGLDQEVQQFVATSPLMNGALAGPTQPTISQPTAGLAEPAINADNSTPTDQAPTQPPNQPVPEQPTIDQTPSVEVNQ